MDTKFTYLIQDTFHRGRVGNAVVADSLCSHPELLSGRGWYGFRCWQRRRSDGLYRRVQSTHLPRSSDDLPRHLGRAFPPTPTGGSGRLGRA